MASLIELRESFQERLKEADLEFHPLDLDRMKDDKYLNRVLKHTENDINQATDMLFEIFTWRQMVDANDINEDNIRIDYIKEGIIFPHGRDIDGCLLLIIKCNKHTKGAMDFEEVTRCIIYWFDRIEREENGNKITLLFDLENCGLTNMDMDLINYLILLLKTYYPYFLNYILIYQMPWVMTAAFKLIKSLLPARGIDKMKFVGRENLKDYVSPEQALSCWGGLDDYVFEFIPEVKQDATSKKVKFAQQNNKQNPEELLCLTPSDTIYFKNDGYDIGSQFTIKNMNNNIVSYKIRTTAPEKFRVRPSSGILSSGTSQTIVVTLLTGFSARPYVKDRFLVMAVQVPKADVTQNELAKIWQDKSNNKAAEYRLKCHYPVEPRLRNASLEDLHEETQSIAALLHTVEKEQNTLSTSLKALKKMLYFVIVTTMLGIICCLSTYFYIKNCERSLRSLQ